MPRRLVVQLARLGDLLQSLPVMMALQDQAADSQLDLVCPTPLASLALYFPCVSQVLPWDGDAWHTLGERDLIDESLTQAKEMLNRIPGLPYSVAYNLNNHARAVLAAHVLADRVVGPGENGPLSKQLPPWVAYVRLAAGYRGWNRVHLSDAFCGMAGVGPPVEVPYLYPPIPELPRDLLQFGEAAGFKVAVVVGAGDADRRVPVAFWKEWISEFLQCSPNGTVLLVGGVGERVVTHLLHDQISALDQGRMWDACGRTSLPQLAWLLSRCQWVIGSDTGPLHLGAACGARAMGLYVSRARVHETGPYGEGHWAWQAEERGRERQNSKCKGQNGEEGQGERQNAKCKMKNREERGGSRQSATCKMQNEEATTLRQLANGKALMNRQGVRPEGWPVRESVELLVTGSCSSVPEGWSLWESHWDRGGAYFTQYGEPVVAPVMRERVWERLSHWDGGDMESLWDLLNNREPFAMPVG